MVRYDNEIAATDHSDASSDLEQDSSRSDSLQSHSHPNHLKTLGQLKTPRQLFIDDFVTKLANEGITSSTDLSDERLEREWFHLGEPDRQEWEARYGRSVLELQQKAGESLGKTPTFRVRYNSLSGTHYVNGLPNWDMDLVKALWQSLKSESKEHKSNIDDAEPSSSKLHLPDSKVSKILYRAELYTLGQRYSPKNGGRVPAAVLEKTFESQMPLVPKLEPREEHLPIFEVTQCLAAPRKKFRRPVDIMDLPFDIPGKRPSAVPKHGIVARTQVGTFITINSSYIIEAIHAVAPEYRELLFDGDSLVVPEPFCLLLQYRDQMLEHYKTFSASSVNDADVLEEPNVPTLETTIIEDSFNGVNHVRELYDFLDRKYLDALVEEQQRWVSNPPTCTFEWLWLLFKPRTLVYQRTSPNEPISKAYMLKHFTLHGLFNYDKDNRRPMVKPRRLNDKGLEMKHILRKITLMLIYLEHDGRAWKQRQFSVVIRPFKGEKPITELPVFPCSFLNDPEGALRSRIVKRGKKYHSLASRGQFEYHGVVLSGTRRILHGRIMIDSETYNHDIILAGRVSPHKRSSRHVLPARRDSLSSESSSDLERQDAGRSDFEDANIHSIHRSDSDAASENESDVARPRSRFRRINGRMTAVGGKDQPLYDTETPITRAGSGSSESGSAGSAAALSDDSYMICNDVIMAYILNEDEWVLLNVDSITECSYDEHMIDDLQLSDETKSLLQALSQSYNLRSGQRHDDTSTGTTAGVPNVASNSIRQSSLPEYKVHGDSKSYHSANFSTRWSSDFVPGKGQGQIILLHGKPGVGKTTSAECLSELTRRPLLTITCGSLGTGNLEVYLHLSRWLRLGDLWNAILLFDEADVFLESREKGELERNTLVSVFLGALEYYKGLIFLTTNRVGVFDEAIMSRIHVVLHFKDLTDADRERIWDTSFRKLDAERSDIAVDLSLRDYIYRDDGFKAMNWNGREIRNAFNTMVALAEWDAREHNRFNRQGKVEIRKRHLQQVVRMSSSFKEYLKSLRGVDEAKYAKYKMVRNDVFIEKT